MIASSRSFRHERHRPPLHRRFRQDRTADSRDGRIEGSAALAHERAGPQRAAGLRHADGALRRHQSRRPESPGHPDRRPGRGDREAGEDDGPPLRRPSRAAPGLRAVRSRPVHARNAVDHSRRRVECRQRSGTHRLDRQPAPGLGQLSPFHPDLCRGCPGGAGGGVRSSLGADAPVGGRRGRDRARSRGPRAAGPGISLRRGSHGRPPRSRPADGPARRGGPGGLSLLGRAAGQEYRRLNGLKGLAGTAVTVQTMVFGNAGGRSGAGVAFSRNPATGEKGLYVDFLSDAQGEDVVSGRRMPSDAALFALRLPEGASELADGAQRLEREYRDVQDIEFTVEHGTLFFLQTRSAKRTPRAALRILIDFVHEGLIDPATALQRVAAIDLDRAHVTRFADQAPAIATAVSASPGVATGRMAFDSSRAKALAAGGEPVVLVRHDTSTEDIAGFAVAAGILTAVGGRTAHAAVVARQLGKVCLVGCHELRIREDREGGEIAGRKIVEGDWVSLDGDHGEVTLGRREIIAELPRLSSPRSTPGALPLDKVACKTYRASAIGSIRRHRLDLDQIRDRRLASS
ncbi:MAG TPA: PEP/pyruvate-binding domain-containing protein [Dongiaceae bacterium]|nr:PEP/pyruvate-binding domain-containing protein [Dongiaceae bacterium]